MKAIVILLSLAIFSSALPLKKNLGVTPLDIKTWIGSFMEGFGFSNYVVPAPNCSNSLVSVMDQTAGAVNLYMAR
jgi:hypothetical protein